MVMSAGHVSTNRRLPKVNHGRARRYRQGFEIRHVTPGVGIRHEPRSGHIFDG